MRSICKYGHPLTDDNVYITPSTGSRRCLTCKKEYVKINKRQFKSEPKHGTRSGYAWHRRDMKEEPCDACTEFERQYWKDHRVLRAEQITPRERERKRRRRDIKIYSSVPDKYTEKQVLKLYGDTCHICGDKIDMDAPRRVGIPGWEKSLHIDHVIPLSRGGRDVLDNVKPSHAQCNIRKGATIDIPPHF